MSNQSQPLLRRWLFCLVVVVGCDTFRGNEHSPKPTPPITHGAAGSGGTPAPPGDVCSDAEDPSRWEKGRMLFVDDDEACSGHEPCFADLASALKQVRDFDTLNVLAGSYRGANVTTGVNLRISGADEPGASVISGDCLRIGAQDRHATGTVWIDHLTFRDCGGDTPSENDGTGVRVGGAFVDLRIQDNWFEHNHGQSAIHMGSDGGRFHAVIARNHIRDNLGSAAVAMDMAADVGEDYCIRLESNLITGSRQAVSIRYFTFRQGPGRFELINNTIADNERGFVTSTPAGSYVFINNIIARNAMTFRENIDSSSTFELHHNLIDSGEFTGSNGNFADDPSFADDYRLRPGSPAADRGDHQRAPASDITGLERGDPPDLGAYELEEQSIPTTTLCGNATIDYGQIKTSEGTVRAFEGCDDGNTTPGDGCSERCQLETRAADGHLSLNGDSLCAIRADASLECWNGARMYKPNGRFVQVALSKTMACALDEAGAALCWTSQGPLPVGSGRYTQLSADADQVCGLHGDGVTCWNSVSTTREESGRFSRVDANGRVCVLSTAGEPTCWPALNGWPAGPYVQLFPERTGACGLKAGGAIVCVDEPPATSDFPEPTLAGLVNASLYMNSAIGLRPDGHIVTWGRRVWQAPVERQFVEVALRPEASCALTADRRVYCWGIARGLPVE